MSEERKSLSNKDPWWGEHVHRYNNILPIISKSDKILDLACGTGYGSHILAGCTENSVTGGDISEEAIAICSATWKKDNLSFKLLDGTALGFEDNYFDKVVSFETIEHTTAYQKMLQEFRRVLKPGGTLFLSTPNQAITSPGGKIRNPYHTQEFSYDELEKMLAIFNSVEIKGQKPNRFRKKGIRNSWDKLVINTLLLRGIRKLPFNFRESIARAFTGQPLYPTDKDFTLANDKKNIQDHCPVLFAICKK